MDDNDGQRLSRLGIPTWRAAALPKSLVLVSRVKGTRRPTKLPYPAEPPGRASGPASQASGRTPRGLAAGETETRRPASHHTLQSDPAMSKALPVRRAVGSDSALPQSSQDRGSLRGGALDRGTGGPADSWTSQPGRPATRDSHPPDGRPAALTKALVAGSVGGRQDRGCNPSTM